MLLTWRRGPPLSASVPDLIQLQTQIRDMYFFCQPRAGSERVNIAELKNFTKSYSSQNIMMVETQ